MFDQKYDWEKLHREYLEGEETNIRKFFRDHVSEWSGNTGGHFDKKTSGWREEKRQIDIAATEKKKKWIIKERASMKDLAFKAEKNALIKLANLVSEKEIFMKADDLKKALEILRVIQGEASKEVAHTHKNSFADFVRDMEDEGEDQDGE